MIEQAEILTGYTTGVFHVGKAQDFKTEKSYDFAYSIACLLHLNDQDFIDGIKNIMSHINPDGTFYFVVKKGEGEEIDSNGRYFNYFSEDKIKKIINNSGFKVLEISEVQDLTRPEQFWLKTLIGK